MFFNKRVDPRNPDVVEWGEQIIEGDTVAEFEELPDRYGIRTTQIFNPEDVVCEIADDEYSPFTALTRITSGNPSPSEFYAAGGDARVILHADNNDKFARVTIYPGGTVITSKRLANGEFKGDKGDTGAKGDTGDQGPAGTVDASNLATVIHAATGKTPPVDADELPLADSAASYALKKLTFANLFMWIISKIYGLTGKTTPVDADQFLITDSAASNAGKSLTWANLKAALFGQLLISGTVQATTSGTSIDFTSIPSWVKKITVMFSGVSTNGTSLHLLQIGDSGGIETTGYDSSISTTGADANSTTGFLIGYNGNAADKVNGIVTLSLIDAANNTWIADVSTGRGAGSSAQTGASGGGSKSLSATLDRVRLTTTNGTDAFDAGKVNILYE